MMKMYHASSFALAGLVPAAAIAPGGQAAIDLALGVAMPVHSHVAMNFVRDSMRWRRETTGGRERERGKRWRRTVGCSSAGAVMGEEEEEEGGGRATDRGRLRGGDRSSATTFPRRREDRRDWRCWRSRRRRRLDCSG